MNAQEYDRLRKHLVIIAGSIFIYFAIGVYLGGRNEIAELAWYSIGMILLGYMGYLFIKNYQRRAKTVEAKVVDVQVVKRWP